MKFVKRNSLFFANLEYLESQFKNIYLIENGCEPIRLKPERSILISDNLENSEVIHHINQKKYSAVLNKNSPYYLRDVIRTSHLMEHPTTYFKDPLKLLFEEIPRSFRINFNKKEDKQRIISEAVKFFQQIRSSMTLGAVYAVLEELFMNSVYDAPREAQKLNSSLKVQDSELMISHDSELIIISCIDYFGSLNIQKFLNRMQLVSNLGAGSSINMDTDKGGAGIGCYILFNHCLDLIVGVQQGKCTRFTCIFPFRMGQKNFSSITKSIQIIDLKSEVKYERKKIKAKK
jgi:hypothetical protein